MTIMPHNIERSAFRHGEYVGWDCNGERYRVVRSRGNYVWWCYPQTAGGIPHFYAPTLASVGERLDKRQSISSRQP